MEYRVGFNMTIRLLGLFVDLLYGTSVLAMLKISMKSRTHRVSLDLFKSRVHRSGTLQSLPIPVVLPVIYPNDDLSYDQKVFTCHAYCIGTCTIQV